MDYPLHVDRPGGDAAYVGIARDVIHVVGRVGSDHGRLQGLKPRWGAESIEFGGRDQVRNPGGVDSLALFEVNVRRRSQGADERSQGTRDEGATDDLVFDPPRVEVVLVEEMAERPVPDVMEEAGDTHRLLDQPERGGVLADGAERWVKMARPLPRPVSYTHLRAHETRHDLV